MNELVYIVAGALIVSPFVVMMQRSRNSQISGLNQKLEESGKRILELTSDKATLVSKNEELERSRKRAEDEMTERRRQLDNEFKVMANTLLEEKSRRFTEINRKEIGYILDPLKDDIEKFRKKVEETYDKESKQRFSLEDRIRELVELNNRIGEDARNLTRALKSDSKVQGNWGEMILESILEKSGLQRDRQYFVQSTLTDINGVTLKSEEGKAMRPDVIIAYPDNRKIIVDSKVSLTSYIRYTEAADEQMLRLHLKEHINSVRKHIDELSRKSYQDYADSVEFVMMFIPNEPAYMLAMQSDPQLWQYAYDKRVVVISPTNLITALKLVADLWKRDSQSKNAIEIAERGGKLYDKFVGFNKKLEEVGSRLQSAQSAYHEAMGQLRDGSGNLIGQVEKLRELGVKAKKQLPGMDN